MVRYAGSEPTLLVNTTAIRRSGEWVQVSWTGIEHPSRYDMGAGALTFKLLNHRAPMQFLLLTNVTDWAGGHTVLAGSPLVELAWLNEPLWGHLALTGSPGEMLVQWTTVERGRPAVRWGVCSGEYTGVALASLDTYARSDMCGGVANSTGFIDPGILNTAKMAGLAPDTRYFYIYGDEYFGWSEEASFFTAPEPGAEGAGVELLALADLGNCEHDGSVTWPGHYANPVSLLPPGTDAEVQAEVGAALHMGWVEYCAARATAARMAADMDAHPRTSLIVHNGDISYAEGRVYAWDVYMDMMAPVLRRAPYMLVQGNHERAWPGTGTRFETARDSGGECGRVLDKRFPMPPPAPGNGWYSFEHGPIHFLQLNTEMDFAPGSAQYAWLLGDLRAVNRTRTPWLVAGMHRPVYTDSIYGNTLEGDVGFTQDLRAALERLFFQFEVDATWYGHVHQYSRTCPVFQSNCMPDDVDGSGGRTAGGPVHVLIGHSGAPLSWAVNPSTPPYYEAVELRHGYLRVLANRTTLALQAIDSESGEVADETTMRKPYGWRANPKGRLQTIALFHANYTPSGWELSGISGYAENMVLDPAEALLFSEPELLERLRNTTLVQNPIAPDSLEALWELLKPLDGVLQDHYAHANRSSPAADFYYREYFTPLFDLFERHLDGVLKQNAPAPGSNAVQARGLLRGDFLLSAVM
ncbi:hypothetical protein WJX81_000461 [Elliptochloris bilobata]|uniref:Purple acid phosphatase n=1 Tax=Elliptochloris bilobata TaxID=381761 RepID=A0AAW1SH07_9CHLO